MTPTTETPVADPDMSEGDRQAAEALAATPDHDLGAGRSLEELAGDPDALADEEGQTLLDFGGTLDLKLKGKKPTDSEIKVKAISTPINGQLGDMGDDEVVTFIGRARLDKVEIVTKRDGDGKAIAKARRHVLTPISFLPFVEEAVEHLLDPPA